jgi:hypothetical protein
VFLHVEPSDSFGHVKRQVGEILEVDPNNILFYAPDKVSETGCSPQRSGCGVSPHPPVYGGMQSRELPDLATIVDQEIKNDAVLYMVFRKGTGTWFGRRFLSGRYLQLPC